MKTLFPLRYRVKATSARPECMRRLLTFAGIFGVLATTAAAAASLRATPAGATNVNYTCHNEPGWNPCQGAGPPSGNYYLTNNYAYDDTHNNACSGAQYANGNQWFYFCSGSSTNTELVCGSQIYGYASASQANLDTDTLGGNLNNYQTCTK